MAIVWLLVVGCGCGLRGGPGVRGFATVVMLIFGGWVPQDLCSSHVRCLNLDPPLIGGGLSEPEF
jgi:hypothetical protein